MDRNLLVLLGLSASVRSLSVRRAWIEMVIDFPLEEFAASLSVRRAWIEIWIPFQQNVGQNCRSP